MPKKQDIDEHPEDVQIFSNPSFRGAAPGRVAGGGGGLARPSAVAVVVEAELEDEGDKAHAAAVQGEMTEQRAGPVPGDAPVESAVEVSVWHDAGHTMPPRPELATAAEFLDRHWK